MSFFEKIIHNLDEQYVGLEYKGDLIKEIKYHIKSILNTNTFDCLVMGGASFSIMEEVSLDSIEICRYVGDNILKVIYQYEDRIEVLSMTYDDSDAPWKFIFILHCRLRRDKFSEFDMTVEFTNNRYCEIL